MPNLHSFDCIKSENYETQKALEQELHFDRPVDDKRARFSNIFIEKRGFSYPGNLVLHGLSGFPLFVRFLKETTKHETSALYPGGLQESEKK